VEVVYKGKKKNFKSVPSYKIIGFGFLYFPTPLLIKKTATVKGNPFVLILASRYGLRENSSLSYLTSSPYESK
jgi:hypothetical protein